VIKHGTGHDAIKAGFKRPAAGKTGTTNDEKDAWFAGFTPDLLAVVWTGFDKKEELDLTGAQAALPTWITFMMSAEADRPPADFPTPPGSKIWKAPPPSEETVDADEGPDTEDKAPDQKATDEKAKNENASDEKAAASASDENSPDDKAPDEKAPDLPADDPND
jgi:penicillin-binding protein 1A